MLVFTRRFLFLILLLILLTLAVFWQPDWKIVIYVCYGLLCILLFTDYFSIIKKDHLKLERTNDKYLSIGAENIIRLNIENQSRQQLVLTIRDEYPADFEVTADTIHLKLEGLHYKTVYYYVKPLKKGTYHFYYCFIRIQGKFGLSCRQYKYHLPSQIQVYPNIIELKKFINLIHQNRPEQLGYRKPVSGNENEFDYLREYQPGDQYKKINWKSTAKHGYPITEVDQKEFNRNILLVLDTGRMMTTQYENFTKLDYAIDTSLILAAASRERKDYFGLVAFSEQVNHFLPPSRKQNVLSSILETLNHIQPDFKKSDYYSMYRFIKKKVTKNSIIFIFSELYSKIVSDELIKTLQLLGRYHQVHLISFEEKEQEAKGKNFTDITRWILQQSQFIDKESCIKDLQKKGIRVIRVNPHTIKSQVVNSYLSC
ncbi:MAG: DUF58 domain-containing protein [Spirochaetes bacterium]|nr:DUF58 domain-containing protein [Spirochaetota bacterium]